MSLRSLLTTATLAFLAIQAAAQCQLQNKLDSTPLTAVKPQLCQTQGAGYYTFSMDVSKFDVPAFLIYDENCTLKGIYSPDQTNDCGSPYVIEDNFLKYVLTVSDVDFNVPDPYFSFFYANGKFSIRNNQCGCAKIGSGLLGEQGCKCAFPVEGIPDKRSVEVSFKA